MSFGDEDKDYSVLSVSIRSLRPNGTAIENVIMRDPSQSHLVEHHLGGIFRCSWPILQKLKSKKTNKTDKHKILRCSWPILQKLNKSGFPTVRKFKWCLDYSLNSDKILVFIFRFSMFQCSMRPNRIQPSDMIVIPRPSS